MASFVDSLKYVLERVELGFDLSNEQVECLKKVASGDNVICVLPTGFGKSLIFQLAPMLLSAIHKAPKVALVISPLLGLMANQVHEMQRLGISCIYIHNEMTADENKEAQINLVTKSIYDDDSWYFQVVEPENIGYTFRVRPAKDFGPAMTQTLLSHHLVPVSPIQGCSTPDNSLILRNSIAFMQRGGCSFLSKVINAEMAGAVAAIVYDHDSANDSHMIEMIGDETERKTSIPSFFLLGKDGYMIYKSLEDMGLQSAVINIPVNATGIPTHRLNQPPWTLW